MIAGTGGRASGTWTHDATDQYHLRDEDCHDSDCTAATARESEGGYGAWSDDRSTTPYHDESNFDSPGLHAGDGFPQYTTVYASPDMTDMYAGFKLAVAVTASRRQVDQSQ